MSKAIAVTEQLEGSGLVQKADSPCPKCGGTGYFDYVSLAPCDMCGGSGRANRPVPESAEGLSQAVMVLEAYFQKHRMGDNAVIHSDWARGVFSGRKEAINILNAEIAALRSKDQERTTNER